ncbi:PQQ-dependent sugar dehydrogenase [Candidatus Methanoperedens nitratireducens]|uniref:Quinoprotein glucose dehydrogenase n=1 Tax=Candidatus Methanoperedens nitratireducens TaxID=1392998 RepID=A0A284VUH6_9EURY|nr:PQQ-dependent sugar dehydrogenase [Candidatus Methanoperedens nitroreducens]SNQ62817.1 Quinoprotein glucose dehydrogenase [Candidatus Methanoperedens nitroreducens]
MINYRIEIFGGIVIKSSNKKLLTVAVIVFVILIIGMVWWSFLANRPGASPQIEPLVPATPDNKSTGDVPLAASVAKNLDTPWALDFLPDGSIIFTERDGRIRLIDAREGLLVNPLLTIDEVAPTGEGGLLGIAVHPDFSQNPFIYVYYTYQNGSGLANKAVRFRMQDRSLLDEKLIIDSIPAASIHDGGRVKFGPDGLLYITTGDAAASNSAQDKNSLAGKILRLNDNGTIPETNPFPGSPVFSFGHRNPQGLAWDDKGRLWATEHGSQAYDELNLIEAGKNYGWPDIRGDEKAQGLVSPVLHSGTDTWAPSGIAYFNGSLFFTGLRGQSLFEVIIGEKPNLRRHLDRDFGRLRDVVVGPDNFLYILTSNRDGRGVPAGDDDRIIRINPGKLE